MKGDFSRDTFDPKKHFARVLMQQGRVQLDADWNEQLDLAAHRVETETADVIGACGTPLAQPGFAIAVDPTTLPAAEQTRLTTLKVLPLQAGDLLIGPGRFYVDGILCENEDYVAYTKQPDWYGTDPTKNPKQPELEILPPPNGWQLAYLDVWHRHLTALDDEALREKALGGPDTATRAKTIWQVKLLAAPPNTKCSDVPNWDATIAPSTGKLRARGEPEPPSPNDCEVPPGAGYRRLENQLYRVEIHVGGTLANATFKWSRENGSVVRKWLSKNVDTLTIHSPGADENLGFAAGDWLELIDDTRELQGKPGTLVQLLKAEGTQLTIKPATATGTVDLAAFPKNPKIRRWEGVVGARKINEKDTADNYLVLEDGVQIKFETGNFRTGDYWLIPARTAIGDFMGGVEWEPDPLQPNKPLAKLPHGIAHHYCKLGILSVANKVVKLEQDCRPKFPSLDSLTCFYYVGGDGQEATPSQLQLPQPLRVGVSNGNVPVSGAPVRFTTTIGNGTLTTTGKTGNDGIATCDWTLENNLAVPSQQVLAELLNDVNAPIHLPIFFNAKLEPPPPARGDSCCVCIGPDGDYKTFHDALLDLTGQKFEELCFCFAPGNHQVEWDDEWRPLLEGVHLTMSGCGRGTRLMLRKRLWFHELKSLLLRDLDIRADETLDALWIEYTAQVHIENCVIQGDSIERGLVVIVDASARMNCLNNVFITKQGRTLLLAPRTGEWTLENNLIVGMVQLYEGTPLTLDKLNSDVMAQLQKLAGIISQGAFPLRGGGTLRVHGNRMRLFTVSLDLLFELAAGKKDLPLLAQTFFSNNRFEEAGNFMLAEHTAFSENAFEPSKGMAAASFAYSAVYVGNRGGDPTFKSLILADISFICDEAANIMLRTPICAKRRAGIANEPFILEAFALKKKKSVVKKVSARRVKRTNK